MIQADQFLLQIGPTPIYFADALGATVIYFGRSPHQYHFTRQRAEQLIDWYIDKRPDIIDGKALSIVPAPACGCCGTTVRMKVSGWRYDGALTRYGDHWRCDKHVGRSPCCVPGCGKTFKGGVDQEFMCGKHWRTGPKDLRAELARILKFGKKHGWTMALNREYEAAWNAARDAILDDHKPLDVDEINRLFGWA